MRKPTLPAWILIGAAALVTGAAAHDAAVPPRREISTNALAGAIRQYRRWVSPHLEGKVVCRFEPTCSAYGLASVETHGAARGGWKAVKRIARCTPAVPKGTVDLP
jgi:hypothetical protein